MNSSNISQTVKEKLNSGETLTVTFTKSNGEERVMKCTQNMQYIPEDKRPKNESAPKAQGLMVVWDIDKSDWRSFKLDTVISYA